MVLSSPTEMGPKIALTLTGLHSQDHRCHLGRLQFLSPHLNASCAITAANARSKLRRGRSCSGASKFIMVNSRPREASVMPQWPPPSPEPRSTS